MDGTEYMGQGAVDSGKRQDGWYREVGDIPWGTDLE